MLINNTIPFSALELLSIAVASVKLDDSILWEVYDVAKYVIVEILPYAIIVIIILGIIILMVEFILRQFR